MTTTFTETQRFSQWWLWILIGGITALIGYGFVQQVLLGMPFGDKPMSDIGLTIFTTVMIGFLIFFASMRLRTRIDGEGIQMRYTPFINRKYKWSEIQSVEVLQYGFVGYGIRYGSKHGIVYNVNGNKGLAIKLKSGKQFVIGTQRPEELQGFLSSGVPV